MTEVHAEALAVNVRVDSTYQPQANTFCADTIIRAWGWRNAETEAHMIDNFLNHFNGKYTVTEYIAEICYGVTLLR